MGRRDTRESTPKSVRLDFKINLDDHLDIAELYSMNPRRFSVTVVEALSLYALVVKKTGAVGLAHAANAIAVGGGHVLPAPFPAPSVAVTQSHSKQSAVVPAAEHDNKGKSDKGVVSHDDAASLPVNGRILSSSAAEALLLLDRDM